MEIILVIDDNEGIRSLLETELDHNGYNVLTSATGKDGIAKLKSEDIDLIIMDQVMPGMDGITTLNEINRLTSKTPPIIMMTAHSSIKLAVEFIKAGGADFITKPMDIELLLTKIDSIVEQVRIKREVRQYQIAKDKAERANRDKSKFIANISHQLRSTIHPILSYAGIGIRAIKTAPREKLLNSFYNIQKNGQWLLTFFEDLVDISKLEAGQMELMMHKHDLLNVVERVAEEFSAPLKENSLTLNIVPPEINTNAFFDKDMISKAVRILISNSLRFSPDYKSISLYFNKDTIGINRQNSELNFVQAVTLTIQNQGAGMVADEPEEIFQKIKLSKKNSADFAESGLDLAICKEIVRLHKGRIQTDNHPQGGSIFRLTLPTNMVTQLPIRSHFNRQLLFPSQY